GHVENFSDPLVDCKKCKTRFREDHLEGLWEEKGISDGSCPECGGELTEARQFNLMFTTHMGPVADSGSLIYLRPETAQGIFVNFKNVVDTGRVKVPFGIAQVGKAFRNEITTKNFIFRTCEFEQMEMQYFVRPDGADEAFEEWKARRMAWYVERLGIKKERLRFHQHGPDELAHYARDAYDIEYQYPFGWQELEGIHSRTDFDLKRHGEYCGKEINYLDPADNSRYIPWVVETSSGLTRSVLVTLMDAYHEETIGEDKNGRPDVRTVLHFHPDIAPDYDTMKDNTVTLRFRDSMEQVRVPIASLAERMRKEIREYKRN
ncbi:MAG: glycine--tRNA ligase, partial [Spirochaetales bacterium]